MGRKRGLVTISPPRGWADSQTRLRTAMDDGDGSVTGANWQWARSSNRSSWTDIPRATFSNYTATADDVGNYVRASVTYTDRRGGNKAARAVLPGRIDDVKPATNSAPEFVEDPVTRTIGQGPEAGRAIGAPVRATDPDTDDVLTYSLLTVTWSAPTDTGSSAISSYDLRHIESAAADKETDANWTVEGRVWTSGALSYVLTGLIDGAGYDVQMRAVNADGVGDWSDTSADTTTDHSGMTSAATILELDSPVPGQINPADDRDVFRIVLAESADLWVYTSGDLSTSGELLDVFGRLIESNDGGYIPPGAQNFSIRAQLSAGTYYVKVGTLLERETGPYVLHAEAVTQPGDSIATATVVALDSLAHGWLDEGDQHFFKIELNAATDLWLLSIGETDTRGRLLDSSQNPLANNNDSELINNETGFTIRRQLGAGTYYVRVSGGTTDSSGPYTLSVRAVTDPGDSTATAKPLSFRLPTAGRLSSTSDEDYFRLTLPVPTYVVIVGVSYDHSTSLTPTVYDDQDVDQDIYIIAQSVWDADGRPERAFWIRGRLPAGTYYVRISSDAGDSGPYMIHALPSASQTRLEELCSGATRSDAEDVPQDPLYGCQWHLENSRLFPGGAGQDINAEATWAITRGATSEGVSVNVVVVDSELDYRHDDLKDRVLTQYNHSYFSGDVRDVSEDAVNHGTSVAGIIAASANDIGGVGVAPGGEHLRLRADRHSSGARRHGDHPPGQRSRRDDRESGCHRGVEQ